MGRTTWSGFFTMVSVTTNAFAVIDEPSAATQTRLNNAFLRMFIFLLPEFGLKFPFVTVTQLAMFMLVNVFTLKTVTCKKYNDLEGRHCKKYRQGKASEKLEMTDRAYFAARGDAGEGSCGTPLLLTGERAVAPAAAGYRARRLLENDHDAR